ncbi:alpha/beta fold hydrolase [Brevundimonas diminuta]|uniref:Pimelyl-[acyl-carrier protein] methyl ester esterase n=1 Tax=Brevundimonas diminuta TaxID=293 RepID=A0A2X1ANW3_BREDI|nr:alpha/beta hydrolase [Brevundimonas diminuta]SPU46378.1 Pimelyl-[acyl-carrier protein] methyl ester esterase [Brevundimonas diminuta]
MNLLLIPGFMADATLWNGMTDDLAPFGPLVATDLSQGEDIERMAAAILADAPERFVAVGFSMGGYVARELARIAPERVEALILIATSARGDTEALIRQRRSSLKAPPRAFKGLSRPAIVSSLHPDLADDEAMITRVRDMGLRLGGEVFHRQSAMARAGDLARLSEIRQPTLIVAADADRLRMREEAEELHRGIAGSTLETVEHSGHMIPLEQPKALARVMTDWLKTLSWRERA